MIPSQVLTALHQDVEVKEELVAFPLPDRWDDLPEPMQYGLSWWHLVDLLYQRRINGTMQPVSALSNVDLHILRTAQDAQDFVPRTQEPSEQLVYAYNGLKAGDLVWVVAEFSYDGPVVSR